jgi:hypothetical protein
VPAAHPRTVSSAPWQCGAPASINAWSGEMRDRFADGIIGNLLAGLRLASWRRVSAQEFSAGAGHVVFALAAYWVLLLLAGKLASGPATVFSIWGFVAAAGRVHLWLSLVLLCAWLGGAVHAGGVFIVALLYAALPVMLLTGVLTELTLVLVPDVDPRYWQGLSFVTGAWLVLSFARASGLVLGTRGRQRTLGNGVYALGLVAILIYLPSTPLFHPAAGNLAYLDIEAVYYRQQAMLDAQLDALRPEDPDAVDLYFLAVAPYASEDVFMREVLAARHIVEARLALGRRTLALINNRATLEDLPLANVPNLRHALAGLATKIDRDEDIVFVYLTSHGNENAVLAADFPPLAPNDVHAHELRAALDAAGILWRVIVVSACYSGSFIEQLETPTTLVVTAAAADRASFGCSHENHWTYFGEAFFAEALTRTDDLVAAAQQARTLVNERERRENRLPSQPQIVIGSHIEQQLARWRAQRSQLSESM